MHPDYSFQVCDELHQSLILLQFQIAPTDSFATVTYITSVSCIVYVDLIVKVHVNGVFSTPSISV